MTRSGVDEYTRYHHGADGREDDDHNGSRHGAAGNGLNEKRREERGEITGRRSVADQQAGNHLVKCHTHHLHPHSGREMFVFLHGHHQTLDHNLG